MGETDPEDRAPFTRAAPAYANEDFVPDFLAGTVRLLYRREPYARVTLQLAAGGAETRDAKVLARTGDSRYLNIIFPDENRRPVSLWIPARQASRIPASESSWRDPYDLDWE